MRGLFVTGTDTGVGKTILSAALVAAMAADRQPAEGQPEGQSEGQPEGQPVLVCKPVISGLDEAPAGTWPHDHELLASMADMDPEEVAPLRYGPAVSPHLAASMAGERIDGVRLIEYVHALGRRGTLIVEGVGGLLVPLSEEFAVRELAVELGLPLLIAARPGLGTINHTLLTLQAARAAGLDVCAVVLTPWPERPSAMERSNRETIARLGEVEVEGLGPVASPDRSELAQAGARLPWQRWLTR